MKKHISIILSILCALSLIGCGESSSSTFKATILEITNNSYLVEPIEGSNELRSADQIMVAMKNLDPSLEPEVGDIIKIKYSGGILETYPAQISDVISIKVVKEAKSNLITMDETETAGILDRDEFWENVTEFVFYDFDENIYKTSDNKKLEMVQHILTEMSYQEIENPWIEGWYQFEIRTNETEYSLGITLDIISFDGKFYKVTDSVGMEISSLIKEDINDDEVITYNGKEYKKSELCDATLHWLELSEQERMLSSYLPPELMIFEETWGITLTAENITTTCATIKCVQSGGESTGKLQTGSWFILENWTQENGWREMPYFAEVCWTEEAWIIPADETTEWQVNWEWLYGELLPGKYRIGKEIMDFRGPGNFDKAIYFAEFEILE